MAKTNTEIIRELEKESATLRERVDNLRSDVARLEKALEESERKHWHLTMSFVGAFLALLVGLVIAFFAKVNSCSQLASIKV